MRTLTPLPSGDDLKLDAFAGAVTGIVEYSVMYPMDVVKTRMQGIKPKSTVAYSSVVNSFKTITRNEGLRRFYRGMPMPFVMILPANASYWVTYEWMSIRLSVHENAKKDYLAQGVSGSLATIARTALTNPAEVVKQRMQMYSSPYRSSIRCLQSVYRAEGITAFYRSYPAQVAIDIPFGAIYFVVYVACQSSKNKTGDFDAPSHILCGALAGGLAAAFTTPVDVCRTLVNTQEESTLGVLDRSKIKGLAHAMFVVYRFHGMRGFARGMGARVVYYVPSAGFGLVTYEFVKMSLFEKYSGKLKSNQD